MEKSKETPDSSKSPSVDQKKRNPLRRYFITGLLVIVPMWGTYLVLKTLFVTLDGVLGNIMQAQGLYYIPGFGILLLISLIFFAGLFTTNIFGRKVFELWEKLLDRLPLVRNVYSLVKSVVDTVSFQTGEKENFRRVVLFEYPKEGLFTYAFVTGEMNGSFDRISGGKVISVFVPTVPNPISGFIIMVPESETIPLTLSVEDAMKIVFSIGLYSPELKVDQSKVRQMIEEKAS